MEESTANVLIVDDVTSNLIILTEMIKSAGYVARPVTSARQAMTAIEVKRPQLILLDISMPEMDGYEFCELLKNDIHTRDIPIIFISAMNTMEDKKKGFGLGAVDFISKPFEVEEVTIRVNTHLKIYQMKQELESYNRRLHKMVNDQMKRLEEEKKNFIFALAKLSELKESTDGVHLRNISRNSKLLAMSLQFSPEFEKQISNSFVESIEVASGLHDIGKISVSDQVLLKPGRLNPEEWEIMKSHCVMGADMLQQLYDRNESNEFLKMAIDIARYHHEWWDGTGYPMGLKGEEIPLAARIVAVVDVYDALVGKRCYKDSYSHKESMDIINQEAGRHFDPKIIEIFNKVQNRLKR